MDTATRIATNREIKEEFFAGSGEMATLMRAHDWSRTPLGPVSEWPQSLRTTVRIMLTSRYAMWMAWGPELIFFCNDAYRPTLGVKGSWALGETARKVWEEIWPDIGPRIEKVLHTGEATWDEGLMLFLERSGYPEETYHTFSYSPLADDGGTISGMLCVVTEETERILGERRLALLQEAAAALASVQTEEEVFTAIASCLESNAHDLPFTLTYLFDDAGNTARLVSATGIPAGAAIAVPVIGQEEGDTPWPLHALRTNPVPVLIEDLPTRFEGVPSGPWDKPPQQAIVFPIAQQRQERPAGFLVAGINPYRKFDTEYRGFISLLTGQIASSLANARAYEEERKRAEALAELDRAKTTFFSNISHELRTPLTLMLGPVEDMLARPEDEFSSESRELLTVAHRNGLRLLKLVNTLLDFTRIEAGRVQARYEPTDLAAYTAELASVFRSAIEKAGMRLSVDCPPLSEPVYIDRDMWEKIVLNLLSNAFKFTLEGEIEVKLRQQDGQAILSVCDTGTGITADQLPHIFERFHRVEGIRARTHEGTGIGLALVQELVHLHGGTVGVESTYGIGTTFTIALPLGNAHLPSERISVPETLSSTALRTETFVEEALRWLPEESQTVVASLLTADSLFETGKNEAEGRVRILVADDNADMREYVQRLLQPHFEVIAVANGAEALQAARESRPALVLSDVMMPQIDGFELLQELRNNPETASIPVILLSARAGEEARVEGLTAGADDYIIKPFNARELMASVKAHIAIAQLRSEAMEAIQRRERIFGALVRASSQSVWHYQPGGSPIHQIDKGNARWWREFTGQTEEQRTAQDGLGWLEAVYEEDREVARRNWLNILTTSAPTSAEFRVRRWDGEWRWVVVTGVPIHEEQGGLKEWAGTIADITERKQAEEVTARHQAEIMRLNERLQRAMTETHHRVKNNLQLISALIDMQRNTSEELVPVSEFTRLSASVRALSVIHDILTQEAKAGSDQETLSVKAVLERLLQGLEQTTRGRALVAAIDDTRLPGRQTTTLALVTNELASNALKHGKGQTDITFRVHGDHATLEVCDDGPGFPEGFDATVAANTGLELVENIVQWDLRGKITYANRPEGGARITVTFPITIHTEGTKQTP